MSFLWEAVQYGHIRSASSPAESASAETNTVRDKVHHESGRLHERVNGMALVCQAMWEIVSERLNVTDEDLKAKIMEIDLRDGVQDGKVTLVAPDCPKCDAKICRKFNRCLFCGYVLEDACPFSTF